LKYIAEDKFLEYANVHKKYFYGTPIAQVISNIRQGINSLLIIDVHGAASIRKNFQQLTKRMVTIFITPEHLKVLEDRLIARGSEKKDELAQRLKSAEHEMKCAKYYDYIVVSGSKEEDFTSMKTIYEFERLHDKPVTDFLCFFYKSKQLAMGY
jgi:guanylate kinase